MKIEPQMDRLHGGNNHKSFIVREAVGGDKRRQSRALDWERGRDCKKKKARGEAAKPPLPLDGHEIFMRRL